MVRIRSSVLTGISICTNPYLKMYEWLSLSRLLSLVTQVLLGLNTVILITAWPSQELLKEKIFQSFSLLVELSPPFGRGIISILNNITITLELQLIYLCKLFLHICTNIFNICTKPKYWYCYQKHTKLSN